MSEREIETDPLPTYTAFDGQTVIVVLKGTRGTCGFVNTPKHADAVITCRVCWDAVLLNDDGEKDCLSWAADWDESEVRVGLLEFDAVVEV